MREKLETLSVAELRKIAKEQGIRGVSALRKAELIDRLVAISDAKNQEDAAQKKTEEDQKAAEEKKTTAVKKAAVEKKTAGAKKAAEEKKSAAARKAAEEKPADEKKVVDEKAKPADEKKAVDEKAKAAEKRKTAGERKTAAEEHPQNNRVPARKPRDGHSRLITINRNRTGQNGRENRGAQRNERSEQRYDRNERSEQRYDRNERNDRNEPRAERQESRIEPRRDISHAASDDFQQEGERQNQYARSQAAPEETSQSQIPEERSDLAELDSGQEAYGILEVMPDGFGFIRCENFLPGDNDVYVAPSQIRRFNLKTGDMVRGSRKIKSPMEKFAALLYIKSVNGYPASAIPRRPSFENLTPIFPNQRIRLEQPGLVGKNPHQLANITALRVMDLLSPIGKGQRGMIVSPPKAGKTTLLKQVATSVTKGYPDMHLIILLIDERPEEVTDIREAITGPEVEVIYSTFDELPEHHKRVSEMTIERAKRLVEHGRDVMILLDSMTRLARAYNLVEPASGRTLSGGLDPAALHMPKRFFGAARNMREGGSLTILATALIETGSRMDDVIYEEFKGTGNMEIVLDRKLSEKRIFPAIDILRSGTRRDDLLLSRDEQEVADMIHKATSSQRPEESVERILDLFAHTRSNADFIRLAKLKRMF